ncbi:MAG: winged helix-turn-helix transcriptional regulator [Candidatus Kerfeldbacteria bacterium]|nr:winged helix-turn-helix transcriptional regulator [Candidatus Kerfeldbacteria bacterium]
MLEKIFGSRTRVKLFRLFLTHPEERYFVRELSRAINEQINSVRRELNNLEEIGMLVSVEQDKKKYYTINQDFILYPELRSLILKSRLTLEKRFIEAIRTCGSIQYLALTGYFVNDEQVPVDLLVVGNVNRGKLDKLLIKFKESFGTQLRFTVMTADEYRYRRDITDKFLYGIINGKKIVVINKMGK